MTVLRTHSDPLRAYHISPAAWLAQATFWASLLTISAYDLRIDQFNQPMIILHINYHNTAQDAHLGRSKPNAFRLTDGSLRGEYTMVKPLTEKGGVK